jgi:hypothetical protein
MAKPVRLQLSRRKGFDLQALSIAANGLSAAKVARPGPFGNPWSVRECAQMLDLTENAARGQVLEWFKDWISKANDHEALDDLGHYCGTREAHATLHKRLPDLRGKNLACFCRLDEACHADVLLDLANRPVCEEP